MVVVNKGQYRRLATCVTDNQSVLLVKAFLSKSKFQYRLNRRQFLSSAGVFIGSIPLAACLSDPNLSSSTIVSGDEEMQPNFQVIFSANAKAGDTIEVSNSAGLSQVLLMDDATHTKFKNFERVSFPGPDNTTRTTATYTIRYDGRWHVLSDGGEGKVTHTKVQIDLPPKHKLSFGDISNREAQAFIADVLRLTNAERTKARLNPLHANDMLHHAAQGHTMNMALQGFQSHTGLDGSIPAVRISVTGYRASLSAENIAFGWQSAEDVVKGWMGSPGHRKNILMRDVTEIGIGIYYRADDPGAENYRYYWTQVFAKPT